ncbi:MAG: hypothetical protein ACRDQ0_13490, partial [Pseudonocardia sp.]
VERGTYVPASGGGLDELDDVAWGLERVLDGVAAYSGERDTAPDAPPAAPTGDDPEVAAAVVLVSSYASDAKVKKAAARRKEADKRVREAQKKVRELEKAARDAHKAEAAEARAAAERAANRHAG